MTLTFVETSGFSPKLSVFFSDDNAYRRFQNALLENPEKGDTIQGTGGLRKVRWVDPKRGKGTRGGIRVIYLLIPEVQTVIFLGVYNKDKQDNLMPEQRKSLASVAEAIRQEMIK